MWMVYDQVLFIWLFLMISLTVLPRLLFCKRSHEVWVHKHFTIVMEAHVRQLCTELKTSKKLNKYVSKFVIRIKLIVDSFLLVGDYISEEDEIDAILDGLLKEYNSIMMQVYDKSEPPTIYDIKELLYVLEAQLDNFQQELSVSNTSSNLAQHASGDWSR
ncbi:unnamed protein product [Vicia faba]|uniref:Uncharacterized protein n=1 Tax=Vicia faba TaxID=3906 RepID=A0AAV0YTW3_VICFA|nr:unnamed protein product [Vicia faba]